MGLTIVPFWRCPKCHVSLRIGSLARQCPKCLMWWVKMKGDDGEIRFGSDPAESGRA